MLDSWIEAHCLTILNSQSTPTYVAHNAETGLDFVLSSGVDGIPVQVIEMPELKTSHRLCRVVMEINEGPREPFRNI
jgi:hypothetical protein